MFRGRLDAKKLHEGCTHVHVHTLLSFLALDVQQLLFFFLIYGVVVTNFILSR